MEKCSFVFEIKSNSFGKVSKLWIICNNYPYKLHPRKQSELFFLISWSIIFKVVLTPHTQVELILPNKSSQVQSSPLILLLCTTELRKHHHLYLIRINAHPPPHSPSFPAAPFAAWSHAHMEILTHHHPITWTWAKIWTHTQIHIPSKHPPNSSHNRQTHTHCPPYASRNCR